MPSLECLPEDEVAAALPVALHQPLRGGDDVVADVLGRPGEDLFFYQAGRNAWFPRN